MCSMWAVLLLRALVRMEKWFSHTDMTSWNCGKFTYFTEIRFSAKIISSPGDFFLKIHDRFDFKWSQWSQNHLYHFVFFGVVFWKLDVLHHCCRLPRRLDSERRWLTSVRSAHFLVFSKISPKIFFAKLFRRREELSARHTSANLHAKRS